MAWKQAHNIIWSFACQTSTNATDLSMLQISLSIWNVTEGFSRPTVCMFLTVFRHILLVCVCVCVCLSVCVCLAVTGEFPDSTDPDEWVTVCPRVCVCVCVWSAETFAQSLSHQCKIFSPCIQHTHAHTQHALCCMSHYYNTRTHFLCSVWFTGGCCFTCQASLLLSFPGSFLTHQPLSHFVTHTHLPKWQSAHPPDTRPWLNINRVPSYCGYPD